MKCNKTHKNITPVLPRSLETIKCLLSIFYGFFIKKIVKNSKIFIISLLKKKKTKILKVMSYEVRIHAPSDLSEKWYVYIYSGGKIIKKFYKGLAKERGKISFTRTRCSREN